MAGCSPNRMGSPVSPGLVMTTWRGTLTSHCADGSKPSMISSLRWTVFSIPTLGSSVHAGPVRSSTCTPACKPCSPSNSPSSPSKINKRPSQAGGRRSGQGQHIDRADNTAGGSDNTSDNT
jgi:hypothetical protein